MPSEQSTGELKFVNPKFFHRFPEGIRMVGSRCPTCSKVYFPKKRLCPKCFEMDKMEEVPLSSRGRLYSYTVAEVGPSGFKAPYAFGFIDLPEGIRVFSLLSHCEPFEETLKLGMDMEMVIEEITKGPEGEPLIGYKFKPLKKQGG